MSNYIYKDGELYHYGVKGMKWGIRKKETVFVSGSSKTQFADSGYYRQELPKGVKRELNNHVRNGNKIIVGDAPGIDRQVQDYLNSLKYDNVEVYGPGTGIRYTANKKWKQNVIDAPEFEVGSKEWLAKKDIAMTNASSQGLAIILDKGSAATRKNVNRLLDQSKGVKVYQLSEKGNTHDKWLKKWVRDALND